MRIQLLLLSHRYVFRRASFIKVLINHGVLPRIWQQLILSFGSNFCDEKARTYDDDRRKNKNTTGECWTLYFYLHVVVVVDSPVMIGHFNWDIVCKVVIITILTCFFLSMQNSEERRPICVHKSLSGSRLIIQSQLLLAETQWAKIYEGEKSLESRVQI